MVGILLSFGLDQSIFRRGPDMTMSQPQGHTETEEDTE